MAASSRLNTEEVIPAKKIKLTDENSLDNSSLQSFRGFQLVKVLNDNAQAKTVAVHGEWIVEDLLRFPCLCPCQSFHGSYSLHSQKTTRSVEHDYNAITPCIN